MASSLYRVTARLSSPLLRRQLLSRGFRSAAPQYAAQPFTMPAMSPTMTEGTISSWKVKEGDQFAAGDVLMEVETDKAQMDVEAPDDGIVAKILVPASSEKVQVGKRIAVLAEPGDDLSTLEIPPEDSPSPSSEQQRTTTAAPSSPKQDVTSPAPSSRPSSTESSAISTPSTPSTRPPQTPSPSVQHLLHTHNIADASSITGTGPKGRLLKGDVLAYLGQINASAPVDLSARLQKMTKLDLSNIKIAPRAPGPAAKKAEAQQPPQPATTQVELGVDIGPMLEARAKTQGAQVPLRRFVERAAKRANQLLPGPPTPEQVFDELVGLTPEPGVTRQFAPRIEPKDPPEKEKVREEDIIDILSGRVSARTKARRVSQDEEDDICVFKDNVIRLTVPVEEELRARVFLARMKGLLEEKPEDLVS